jgi:hypothetical protein
LREHGYLCHLPVGAHRFFLIARGLKQNKPSLSQPIEQLGGPSHV